MDWAVGMTDLINDVLTCERIVRYGNGSCVRWLHGCGRRCPILKYWRRRLSVAANAAWAYLGDCCGTAQAAGGKVAATWVCSQPRTPNWTPVYHTSSGWFWKHPCSSVSTGFLDYVHGRLIVVHRIADLGCGHQAYEWRAMHTISAAVSVMTVARCSQYSSVQG